jgi:hypothetical protein
LVVTEVASMRRILVLLTMAAVLAAIVATPGTPASAQSPCPPTGPSDGPATLLLADEPVGAGFVCLEEEAQEFFCPPEFELQLFPVLPGETSGPGFIVECVELSPSKDGGGTGGVGLTQYGLLSVEGLR